MRNPEKISKEVKQVIASLKDTPSDKDYKAASFLILFVNKKYKEKKVINKTSSAVDWQEIAEEELAADTTFWQYQLQLTQKLNPNFDSNTLYLNVIELHVRAITAITNFMVYGHDKEITDNDRAFQNILALGIFF